MDIKFLYEEESKEATRKESVTLTAEMMANLPEDLLQELRGTILVMNREDALEVIARIADRAPEAAAALKELVNNYQMDELRSLLEIDRRK